PPGGLLADVVLRAIGLGTVPQALLDGLGPGAGLSDLLGAAPRRADGPSAPSAATSGGGAAEPPGSAGAGGGGGAGAEGAGTGGAAGSAGAGTGADGGSGADGASRAGGGSGAEGSGSAGEGAGTGGEAGAAGAADATGSADAGAEAWDRTTDAGGAHGLEAAADGPSLTGGTTGAARFAPTADEDPLTLLDRLLEMLGDVVGPGTGGASTVGDGIGAAGLDG